MTGFNVNLIANGVQSSSKAKAATAAKAPADAADSAGSKTLDRFFVCLHQAVSKAKPATPKAILADDAKAPAATPEVDEKEPLTQDEVRDTLKQFRNALQQALPGLTAQQQAQVKSVMAALQKLQLQQSGQDPQLTIALPGQATDDAATDLTVTDATGIAVQPEADTKASAPDDAIANLLAMLTLQPAPPEPRPVGSDIEESLENAEKELDILNQDDQSKSQAQTKTDEAAIQQPLEDLTDGNTTSANVLAEALQSVAAQVSPELKPKIDALVQRMSQLEDAPVSNSVRQAITKLIESIRKAPVQPAATAPVTPELKKALDNLQQTLAKFQDASPQQDAIAAAAHEKGIPADALKNALKDIAAQLPGTARRAGQSAVRNIGDKDSDNVTKIGGKSISQLQFELNQPAAKDKNQILDGVIAPKAADTDTDLQSRIAVESLGSIASQGTSGAESLQSGRAINAAPHVQVADAIEEAHATGRNEISIKLAQNELGDVRLTMGRDAQNQMTVRMVTQTAEARDALQQNLDTLVDSLARNGVHLGRISVVHAGSAENGRSGQDQTQQDEQQKQQQQQSFNGSQSDGRQHQHAQQSQAEAFASLFSGLSDNRSGSFTDGGQPGQRPGSASSNQAFDMDVEGEEVSSAPAQRIAGDALVDVRI